MQKLGEFFPDPRKGRADPDPDDQVMFDPGDMSTPDPASPVSESEVSKGQPHIPTSTSKPGKRHRRHKQFARPDDGPLLHHAVQQGIITFCKEDKEWVLAPWQVIPFSEGYEFVAKDFAIRYHRGVYHVDENGDPVMGAQDTLSFARQSFGYVTAADTICGFSGMRWTRTGSTCDRLKFIRDGLSTLDPANPPWVAAQSPSNEGHTDLHSILPRFWVELEEGSMKKDAPVSNKHDVTTGEVVKNLIPVDDWHFLAPMSLLTPEMVELSEREHGFRFLCNRIYLSGTGIGPFQHWKADRKMAPTWLHLEDLSKPDWGKLLSVITPCLIVAQARKKQKRYGGQPTYLSEVFGIPSVQALRNLLGNHAIAGKCALV